MASRVKMYGSTHFTPDDLPSGVTLERGDFPYIWAGCLGTCAPCPDGCPGYNPPNWRTSTSWSFGGYGRADVFAESSAYANILSVIQDENTTTGHRSFVNFNAGNKRVIAQVGADLPDGSQIEYVRIWGRFSCVQGRTKYWQPYWQQCVKADGTIEGAGSTQFPSISSAKTWDTTTKFAAAKGAPGAAVIQKSSKWTTVPVTGETWNAALMARLAWGVRHGKAGQDGQPYWSIYTTEDPGLSVNELGVEVGFDAAADYAVTTGPALSVTGTSATITGTVDPKGDTAGDYFFQYGTTTALGTETAHQPQPAGDGVSYSTQTALTGLTSDTLYYYRACATDSRGIEHYGEKLTFLTVSGCSTRASLVGG